MSPSTRRFARHHGEMLVAMFAGMVVLGLPAEDVEYSCAHGGHGARPQQAAA